jgi:PAS domain S-box-containing protein
LNAITDPVLIIDRDFKILFANTASLDLCGVGREGIVGRNCREISRRCPLPCVLSGKCPLQEVFATGNPSRIKQRFRCSEGTERTFDVSVSPLKDAEGRVVQMIEVIKDITAEENAAEALDGAVDLRKPTLRCSRASRLCRRPGERGGRHDPQDHFRHILQAGKEHGRISSANAATLSRTTATSPASGPERYAIPRARTGRERLPRPSPPITTARASRSMWRNSPFP